MQTILVAMGDQVISMLLSEQLLEEEYFVTTVSDPWMLGRAIQESHLDLLIIDEFFGEGKGLDLCWELRKYLLETQVIIWASWISALGRAGKRLSSNFHVFKTHTLQELTREICRRMRQPAAQRTREKPLLTECLLGR